MSAFLVGRVLTRRLRRNGRRTRDTRVGGSRPALRALCFGAVALLLASPAAADLLPDPLAAGWKGEKVCVLKEETERHRLLLCTFPPGVGHERHFHAPHFGYVLEGGRMRITDEKGVREVETKRGDSWRSDGIEWHEALNIGDAAASYLIFEPKGE